MIQELMNSLMLSCRKATALMEKQTDGLLSRHQKVQLYMHTHLCQGCRLYQRQSRLLDEMVKMDLKQTIEASPLTQYRLSPVVKNQLPKKIKG